MLSCTDSSIEGIRGGIPPSARPDECRSVLWIHSTGMAFIVAGSDSCWRALLRLADGEMSSRQPLAKLRNLTEGRMYPYLAETGYIRPPGMVRTMLASG